MSLIRSNIWLADGNIVIQADGVQFKVHQGYLARLSTIFSDAFSMPQPRDGAQLRVDGCHVLHLQDSAQDLAVVLSEIYDRIGRKYEIQHIFKEGGSRLRAEFPNTLWELSRFESQAGWLGIDVEEAEGTKVLFRIVNFCTARSDIEELTPILPIAYYRANLRSIETILAGEPRLDDSPSVPLSPKAQRTTLLGRHRLLERYGEFFAWVDSIGQFGSPFDWTPHTPQCSRMILNLTKAVWKPKLRLIFMLRTWDEVERQLQAELGMMLELKSLLCDACYGGARKTRVDARQRLGNDLPGLFGFQSWAALHKVA
ncbi:hypothetical protein FA13DRAFT_1774702 [Coprinellus micaceus]|uniref:BTB domain-containing protein n=1 Tax=Coprinellus micaceus TaxID=71717 RepID=A0A4Y7T9C0_COPMI|nr:hypothetical protein FA13DRAFT_1774702 [Coprinellus micaceus]